MSNASEDQIVKVLYSKVCDQLPPYYDAYYDLLRWVKAWNGDMTQIMKHFTYHLEVRRAFGLDAADLGTFLDSPKSHEAKVFDVLSRVFGVDAIENVPYDRTGNPVIVFKLGRLDMDCIQRLVSCRDIFWFIIVFCEIIRRRILEMERKLGRPLAIIYVQDLEGIDITKLVTSTRRGPFRIAGKLLTDLFPEQAAKIIIVNAPTTVNLIVNAAKMMFPKGTTEKISCFGTSGYSPALLKMIGAEGLPIGYGGTFRLPTPTPNLSTIQADTVDWYSDFKTALRTRSRDYAIPPRANAQVTVWGTGIGDAFGELRWSFTSDSCLQVRIEKANSCRQTDCRQGSEDSHDWEPVVPLLSLDTHYLLECGSLEFVQSAGCVIGYRITLINHSTYLMNANLKYNIEVVSPNKKTQFCELKVT
jgi:hypothetical protein